jgi:preprotein translocase subunit SecE
MANQPVQTVNTSADKTKVALAIVAAIAGVVGFYYLSDKTTAVAIALAWTSVSGQSFINFAKESIRETKKVVWPTRKEALQITAIVFVFVLVMALFLWGTDKLLEFLLYDLVLGWK